MKNTATNPSTALIPVCQSEVNSETVQTVNARDLHSFLEVSTRFNDWITIRIKDFGFVGNQDFVAFTEKLVSGGKRKEYHLTLDMAKELSMVERNDKGKEARKYFIECERIAKSAPILDPSRILSDPAAMRGLLLTYTEKVIALQDTIKEQEPKIAALNRIAHADGVNCITDTAKVLQVRPKDLFDLLSSDRWIYRRPGGKEWVAYQDKIQQGLLTHKVTIVLDMHTGKDRVIEHVLVTPKGLAKLAGKMQEVTA